MGVIRIGNIVYGKNIFFDSGAIFKIHTNVSQNTEIEDFRTVLRIFLTEQILVADRFSKKFSKFFRFYKKKSIF